MDFTFKCTRCGHRLNTAVSRIGTPIRCRECTLDLEVPLTGFCSGMVLDDYWIHHRMGTGTISEVYLAKHRVGALVKKEVKSLEKKLI